MVSGFRTSPLDRSRIISGEARLMVILEKLLEMVLSFLKAIFCRIKYYNRLKNRNLQPDMHQYWGISGCGIFRND
jgi:hypothetical protein